MHKQTVKIRTKLRSQLIFIFRQPSASITRVGNSPDLKLCSGLMSTEFEAICFLECYDELHPNCRLLFSVLLVLGACQLP